MVWSSKPCSVGYGVGGGRLLSFTIFPSIIKCRLIVTYHLFPFLLSSIQYPL